MIKELRNEYICFSFSEILKLSIKALGVILLLDYFFYKSIIALPFLFPIGILFFVLQEKASFRKKRLEVCNQFKELMEITVIGLKAGYSAENAIEGSYEELKNLFGKDSVICRMIKDISALRKNHRSIPDYFILAGRKMGIEQIEEFGRVYAIAYQSSGNLSLVLEKCAQTLSEKLQMNEEIESLLNEKVFESNIMSFMPFIIMGYIDITSPGYFKLMYKNTVGIIVMTVCLAVYMLAYIWSYRLSRIEV